MSIGQRIRAARVAKGWTQQDLANAIRTPTGRSIWTSQISRWEKGQGQPFYATVQAIARALDAPELLQPEHDQEAEVV